MTNNRFFNHCLICALILVTGLGLALVLPWLASSQGLAAQSKVPVQNNAPEATPYYVAITGTGLGGLTWTAAFTNVQDALAVAADPSEIWVAKGVYYPDEGDGQINDSVTATFLMTDGVILYGGFNFGDGDMNDRDWENNLTVLSGDVDGDDTSGADGVAVTVTEIVDDNAYHVVTAKGVTGTAVLDGFTITAGQAVGDDGGVLGGGYFCDGYGSGNHCNPTLRHIIFSGNYAILDGGAMYNSGDDGGSSSPVLTNVTFSGNSAGFDGGAMYNNGESGQSNPTLIDVTFYKNSSNNGGAMYNTGAYGSSSPSLTNITFTENTSRYNGGAMWTDCWDGNCHPALTGVVFSGNSAERDGGAMYNEGDGGNNRPIMTNVIFSGNSSAADGGAMYNDGDDSGESSPTLINVVFSGNKAGNDGGAIYNDCERGGDSSPTLTNVTFSGNSAGNKGGAILNSVGEGEPGTCSPQVRNTILWNNKDSSGTGKISSNIYNITATISLSNSLVQASGGSTAWALDASYIDGGFNIDSDPMFITPVDPSKAPTTTGNLRLQEGSPAIDVGDNDYVVDVPADLDGEARVKDGDGDGTETVDMGAYEAKGYYYLTVTKAGTGGGQVTSSPSGIDCGETCSLLLKEDSSITLTATADEGSTFNGWSGACSGSGDCELTMDAANSVTANFEAALKVLLPIIFR